MAFTFWCEQFSGIIPTANGHIPHGDYVHFESGHNPQIRNAGYVLPKSGHNPNFGNVHRDYVQAPFLFFLTKVNMLNPHLVKIIYYIQFISITD